MATRRKTTNPRLHEGLIYVILSRLPVKSLLRCKTVCKSWLSIISSRDFIKTHLSISTNDPHLTHHGLIISGSLREAEDDPPWLHLWTCSLRSLLHEPFTETLTLWNEDHLRPESIVGCCNGLVLVKNWRDKNLFLWNPSTRKSRTLPQLDMENDVSSRTDFVFGYDEWSDDFKVFALSPAHSSKYKVSVYSLKSDRWRTIGESPFGGSLNPGKFAVGAIHWFPSGKMDIVSLDIKTETYREILLPDFGDGDWCWDSDTFGESHSVLCKFGDTGPVDFWVTNNGTSKKSWTKVLTIPKIWGLNEDSNLKFICRSINGDIMLQLDSILLLYNLKDTTFKIPLADQYFKHLNVYTYVESLVSPHP